MKRRDVKPLDDKPADVLLICEAGAAHTAPDLPIGTLREIRPIAGARRSDRFCAAVVRGRSLSDDGIFDGDCAIVRLTFESYEITPGRLVVVLTPYGLLIKHIYLTLDQHVRLVSACASYSDLLLEPSEVKIQGIVVRIERDL